jgi:uncharacterized protein
MKIIHVTDMHGDMWKYDRLMYVVKKHQPDIVIDSGDMISSSNLSYQDKFIEDQIAELMKDLSDQGIIYLLMPGNHDLDIHDALFERTCSKFNNVFYIAQRKVKIEKYEFIGMNFITDFVYGMKNRCRKDKRADKAEKPIEKAVIAQGNGIVEVKDWTGYINGLPTIEDELKTLVRPDNMANAVYIMHMPPSGIGLSACEDNRDGGSDAIYEFLKENQPMMSLHGHMHYSPEISGKWKAEIGRTICIQPGQMEDFVCAVIDLDTKKYERIKL